MNKPLSLKEKLALKKQGAAQEAPTPAVENKVSASTEVAAVAAAEIKKEPPANVVELPKEAHAVVDLRPKIHELASLSGEDLTNAMKELKGALMQNPSAVELMLPEDIGEMVAALRKITGQAIVEASTKKTKAAAKPKQLSKDEMMAAFDEL